MSAIEKDLEELEHRKGGVYLPLCQGGVCKNTPLPPFHSIPPVNNRCRWSGRVHYLSVYIFHEDPFAFLTLFCWGRFERWGGVGGWRNHFAILRETGAAPLGTPCWRRSQLDCGDLTAKAHLPDMICLTRRRGGRGVEEKNDDHVSSRIANERARAGEKV